MKSSPTSPGSNGTVTGSPSGPVMVTLGRPSVRPTADVGTRSTFSTTWVRTAASAVMPLRSCGPPPSTEIVA